MASRRTRPRAATSKRKKPRGKNNRKGGYQRERAATGAAHGEGGYE